MNRAPQGRLLYDAGCGFCAGLMHRWEPLLRRQGYAPEPGGAGLRDVTLELPDGQRITGAAVYLHIAGRIWWLAPAAWLFRLPPLRAIADAAYRLIARNRYCLPAPPRVR